MKPKTALLWLLAGYGACSLGVGIMQGGKTGISVANRSGRAVRVHTRELTPWKDQEVGTLPTEVSAGATAPLAVENDPTSVWVVFDDAEGARPLGMVRVSERDRRGDEYVVPYPPEPGRMRKETPRLPGAVKRDSPLAKPREGEPKGDRPLRGGRRTIDRARVRTVTARGASRSGDDAR